MVKSQEIPINIVERINEVNYIFEGQVINSEAYYNAEGTYIYTSNTVEISKLLKGDIDCGTIEIITEGGQVGDNDLEISHSLELIEGSIGIFLCTETDRPTSIVDFYLKSNPETLEAEFENQSFIRYWWDGEGINAADLWQNYDSLALVYNVTETISGATFIDCGTPSYESVFNKKQPIVIDDKEEVFPVYTKADFQKQIDYADFKRKNYKEKRNNKANDKIFYKLSNFTISGSNQKYLEFDVTVKDDIGTKYLDQSAVRLTYDTVIFGQKIVDNNNILVSRGSINADPNCYSSPSPSDANNNTVLITAFETTYSQCKNQVLTAAQTLMHLKIKIKDCSLPGEVALEDTITFFGTGLISEYSAYADFPNDTFQTYYANVEHNQIAQKPDCKATITNFSPKKVAGGIGDTLFIRGYQFGNIRGAGNVYFNNADDGGKSEVYLDAADFALWSDTLIKILVPSYDTAKIGNVAQAAQPLGTGLFRLVANDGTLDYSPEELIVEFSIQNNVDKKPYTLTPWTDFNGAYIFRCDTGVANYKNGKMKTVLDKALRDWSCLTGINWYLGTDTIYTDSLVKLDTLCIIKFDSTLENENLAVTNSRLGKCSSEPVLLESDIRINSNYDWFCDTLAGSVPLNEKDFYAVILHELGHAHNLKHIINPLAIMHYSTNTNTRKINLDSDSSCKKGGNWVMGFSTDLVNIVNCNNISNISVTSDFCMETGIAKNKKNSGFAFTAFPNPTKNLLTIISENTINHTVNVLIRDITGKIIYLESFANFNNRLELNFSAYSTGMYLLSIQNTKTNQIETFKISKQ